MDLESVIAQNRFGLGANNGSFEKNIIDRSKLLAELKHPITYSNVLPDSSEILSELNHLRKQKSDDKTQTTGKYSATVYRRYVLDSLSEEIETKHGLQFRLLNFFSNHFSVSTANSTMRALAPTLEREAIAPNLSKNFESMLLDVSKHPAMLIYLNNERSFGPNSRLGKKQDKGLNENLAREILELHTLGVNGGYTQIDVTELAKGITGWSVDAKGAKKSASAFVFRDRGHEPGSRTLLNQSYPQKDIQQGEEMLKALANHPNTARFVSTKLARHFISDTPSQSLVNKMTDAWHQSKGNIQQVVIAMLNSSEAWQVEQQKFKTPREFVISTARAVGGSGSLTKKQQLSRDRLLLKALQDMGQSPFNAGSPAGYSDNQMAWNGANALMTRIEWAAQFSSSRLALSTLKTANTVPGESGINLLLERTLGNGVSMSTRKSVLRAESETQALTLLLMSPEFQRR